MPRHEYLEPVDEAGEEQVLVRPWAYATLVLTCSKCDAEPGQRCRSEEGRTRPFHFERYQHARALAGRPLKSRAVSSSVAADVGGEG
jgi:hypothetical protein